jgi:hypothetical protein
MNTIDPPGASSGRAAVAISACDRALVANTRSQASESVAARPLGASVPTLSTSPSRPPNARSASPTILLHASGWVTSPITADALPCSSMTAATVAAAASASRSPHATLAPSRAARIAIARPFPTVPSYPSTIVVPAPTTRIRRPRSRSRPGARPSVSGGTGVVALSDIRVFRGRPPSAPSDGCGASAAPIATSGTVRTPPAQAARCRPPRRCRPRPLQPRRR